VHHRAGARGYRGQHLWRARMQARRRPETGPETELSRHQNQIAIQDGIAQQRNIVAFIRKSGSALSGARTRRPGHGARMPLLAKLQGGNLPVQVADYKQRLLGTAKQFMPFGGHPDWPLPPLPPLEQLETPLIF